MPRFFEDFAVGIYDLGQVEVTEAAIVAFASQFDPVPIHVDPEAAAAGPFGGLIASGWHVGSMWMRLFVEGLIGQAVNLGSPGIDEARFLVPVRPGDVLTGRFTVERAEPSTRRPHRGTIHGLGELVNQHGQVVFRMRARSLIGRRP